MRQQRFLLLPDESPEDFAALRKMWRTQYDFDEPAAHSLVETLVERDWLQQRCTRRICDLEIRIADAESMNHEMRIERLEVRLQNAYRYKTAAENSFQRALRIVEQFRRVSIEDELERDYYQLAQFKAVQHALYCRFKSGMPAEVEFDYEDDEDRKRAARSKPHRSPTCHNCGVPVLGAGVNATR